MDGEMCRNPMKFLGYKKYKRLGKFITLFYLKLMSILQAMTTFFVLEEGKKGTKAWKIIFKAIKDYKLIRGRYLGIHFRVSCFFLGRITYGCTYKEGDTDMNEAMSKISIKHVNQRHQTINLPTHISPNKTIKYPKHYITTKADAQHYHYSAQPVKHIVRIRKKF